MNKSCSHLDSLRDVTPLATDDCEECIKAGGDWVSLRQCLSCGHVGCCDSSPFKHARAHFEKTGHPIIRSAEQGENWEWCYIDEAYVNEEEAA